MTHQTADVMTQYVLVVVTEEEMEEARRMIADVLADSPAAILPHPAELLAIEYAGMAWDFINGDIVNPDPQPHLRPAARPSNLPKGVYRCQITGGLYEWKGEMKA